jgi:hypothetical protein
MKKKGVRWHDFFREKKKMVLTRQLLETPDKCKTSLSRGELK